MEAKARPATTDDIGELVRLYRLLELEMTELHPMWSKADGLPEPIEDALSAAIVEADTVVYVGELEGAILGFVLARSEDLLPQADDRVAAVRLVFTEQEAREVGLGAEMLETVLDELRRRGHTLFDAHVLPGHRLAKNFFESAGFSARSIVMHHNDSE
ncbi:MAG: GNAT family N-acetyltransferase [Acidimicrobiia bacterium]